LTLTRKNRVSSDPILLQSMTKTLSRVLDSIVNFLELQLLNTAAIVYFVSLVLPIVPGQAEHVPHLCSKKTTAMRVTGDHLSGKPGYVREFDSCQGNVTDYTKNQGNIREKILSGKRCLKLFIVSCILASIQVFSRSLFSVKY